MLVRRFFCAMSPVLASAVVISIAGCGGSNTSSEPATTNAAKGAEVVSAAGDIAPAVDRFRNLLGSDNAGVPGTQPQGRREITWDSVPDQYAEPHALPGDFFNAPTAPRDGDGEICDRRRLPFALHCARDENRARVVCQPNEVEVGAEESKRLRVRAVRRGEHDRLVVLAQFPWRLRYTSEQR